MNPIALFGLAVMLACYVLAAAKLVSWWLDRRDARRVQEFRWNQIEGEGRALLAKARQEREERAALYARWEEDTACGAFPDRAARDAWLERQRTLA